jgi:hypothetical protein
VVFPSDAEVDDTAATAAAASEDDLDGAAAAAAAAAAASVQDDEAITISSEDWEAEQKAELQVTASRFEGQPHVLGSVV